MTNRKQHRWRARAWRAAACTWVLVAGRAPAADWVAYVGTYTQGTASEGIHAFRFDDETGAAESLGVTGGVENPSFLAVHPGGTFLYCVNEVAEFRGRPTGAVCGFAIDAGTGALTPLNQQAAGGAAPCHLCVDASGRRVMTADYTGGTVTELPVARNGFLGPAVTLLTHTGSSVDPVRQTAPHPHQVVLSPGERYALVPDLGLDQLRLYRFDRPERGLRQATAPQVDVTPGSGPRHLVFSASGRTVYVANELNLTIDQFDFDSQRGQLTHRAVTALVPDESERAGVSAAEIAIHPRGHTLYASVRGRDEIVAFRVDDATGELNELQRLATGGQTPRFFTLDPSGRWLLAANQQSGSITLFRVADDGRLAPSGESLAVPAPVCLVFVPPAPRQP